MGVIENIKLLFSIKNWRYSVLTVWLIVGIGFMRFFPVVGTFIFLPLLAFLCFCVFFSLISKKNIEEYPSYQTIIAFFIALPILFIIFIFLVILALIAVIIYIFLSSWFILYWCYLTAYNIDSSLKERRFSRATRGLEFIGGFITSLILLGAFITGSIIYILFLAPSIPIFINIVYLVVGIILIIIFVYDVRLLIDKKKLVGWSGVFLPLISIYTFYLVIQVFLSLSGAGTTSLLAQVGLFVLDIGLLIYAISTMISDKAELLVQKLNLKYFGIDSAIIILIASKACYEFYNNFDYELLKIIPIIQDYIAVDSIIFVASDLSLYKNFGILIFFIILIVIVGAYETKKYIREDQEIQLEEFEKELIHEKMGGFDQLENLLQEAEMEEEEVLADISEGELEKDILELEKDLKEESSSEDEIYSKEIKDQNSTNEQTPQEWEESKEDEEQKKDNSSINNDSFDNDGL